MTARVEAERAIADVLAGHGWEWTDGFRELICDCDEFFVDGYADAPEGLALRSNGQDTEIAAIGLHRAHVASVLADLMVERQAEAWDEGFNDGAHYASADLSHATYRTPPPANPYQRASE